ncbi:sigma 54-interacting transcriptional regulator [Sedimentibacter hydroxybenzoicus DSM 7310]|uniref:Sigma 54-interacting transcriptional regulator n=1 Tax=Sedimentibacter hydroxybenzoicus DSM 7310 TaxID=1123245 RepID=A0A974BNE7_SEDHY|nr:sigma 54-interacting transcriptional regulator [Sedimentibacter hydroxybenzoicus]NYB76141.1 sigma 54-interacting transcriptional regulator [Sedimentibacter hydroxybenzoicus DSM 7310]
MINAANFTYGLSDKELIKIIDALYDEILIYDNNYTIVYINQACLRHYSCESDDMIGKSFFDFIHKDWWSPSILPVVYKEKKPYAIKQRTFTGHELLTIAVPIFDEKNQIKYVAMNVRDDLNQIELYNPNYISCKNELNQNLIPLANSREMKITVDMAERLSQIDVTCILTGESGTGKTMLARYIHSLSKRKEQPYISINCASLPQELVESELFGYVKGAFTGANSSGKKGLFEAANGGTLLLDEISELSMSAQAKMLHVLQEQTYIPIGGSVPKKVNVRIIAATNKNLKNLVSIGQFREDLYYRLNIIEIAIPALRNRKVDIPDLIDEFLNNFNNKYNLSKGFTPQVISALVDYDWPGNVRELLHMVERLVVTTDGNQVGVSSLPKNIFGIIEEPSSDVEGMTYQEKMDLYESNLVKEAYMVCGSSRKVAEYLSVSQTKANNLIRKYIKNK